MHVEFEEFEASCCIASCMSPRQEDARKNVIAHSYMLGNGL